MAVYHRARQLGRRRKVALSIAVIQSEGAAPQTVYLADVVVRDVREALQLLLNPLRLTATLRT